MNATYLRLEIVRLVRNKRVLIFSMLIPALLVLIIGGSSRDDARSAAYIMISMGLFGAMSAALATGGTIAVERGLGWNRTLRLTPLRPGRYVSGKVVLSLILAVPPLLVTFVVGVLALHVRLDALVWLQVFLGSWLSVLPFAALGLVIGYLAKPDSVQQIGALFNLVLAALGGLWVPVELMPHLVRQIASYTPAYWAGQVARSPLLHGQLNRNAIVVLLAWAAGLGLIALRRFRVDTARS